MMEKKIDDIFDWLYTDGRVLMLVGCIMAASYFIVIAVITS